LPHFLAARWTRQPLAPCTYNDATGSSDPQGPAIIGTRVRAFFIPPSATRQDLPGFRAGRNGATVGSRGALGVDEPQSLLPPWRPRAPLYQAPRPDRLAGAHQHRRHRGRQIPRCEARVRVPEAVVASARR
jgi:hypothetical protein